MPGLARVVIPSYPHHEETPADREHIFRNPRDGWVYLAAEE